MAESPAEQFIDALEAELNGQRASTLGRYGRMLERTWKRCVDELEMLEDGGPTDVDPLFAYRRARSELVEARSAYLFQREMLGLIEHHRVDEMFPVPPAR